MTAPNVGEDVKKLDYSYTAGDNVQQWHSHHEKQFGCFLKKSKHKLPITQQLLF